MKRQFSFQWAALAVLAALTSCTPYSPASPGMGSALVTVECRNTPVVRQIMVLLRSGRAKDINVVADGAALEITAAFSPADTPPGKLAQILQDISNLNSVIRAEVVENPHPIRQSFLPSPSSYFVPIR